MIGINDLARRFPNEVIIANYRKIIQQIRLKSPRTKIYIQSVLPVYSKKAAGNYKTNNPLVLSLNENLKKFAKEQNITYINLYDFFADANGELREELTRDGIHLYSKAYIIWVDYLKKNRFL